MLFPEQNILRLLSYPFSSSSSFLSSFPLLNPSGPGEEVGENWRNKGCMRVAAALAFWFLASSVCGVYVVEFLFLEEKGLYLALIKWLRGERGRGKKEA